MKAWSQMDNAERAAAAAKGDAVPLVPRAATMTLTPEQAEVIARIRQRMALARRKPPVPRLPRDRTGATRLRAHIAARYARIAGCSVSAAARVIDELTGVRVSRTSTYAAWHKLYPGCASGQGDAMSVRADDVPIGTLLEWPAPPRVVQPLGQLPFAAPGTIGQVTGIVTGPDGAKYTAIRFQYRTPSGSTSWSPPIGVLPDQPCRVIDKELT